MLSCDGVYRMWSTEFVSVELALRSVRHEAENADVRIGHDHASGSGNVIEPAVVWGSSSGSPAAAYITACPECRDSPEPITNLERTPGFRLVGPEDRGEAQPAARAAQAGHRFTAGSFRAGRTRMLGRRG